MSSLLLMTAAAGAAPRGGVAGLFDFMIPMVLVLLIFYLLIMRPQQKRMKQHQATIEAVKKGDEVITAGGIRGKVMKVMDDDVEVEISQGTRVRIVKNTLSHVATKTSKPAND